MHNRKLRNKNTNFLKFKNSWGEGGRRKKTKKKEKKIRNFSNML